MEHALVHQPVPDAKSGDEEPEAKTPADEQKNEDVVRPH